MPTDAEPLMAHDSWSRSSMRTIMVYLAWLAGLIVPPNVALLYVISHTPHALDAREKIARFAREADRYDLVFVGDSRTYSDFDPEQIDPLLGTHSINLAYWAHWFPTQYASFQDLIPLLKPGTVVVWSIGHLNFRPVFPAVNFTYPLGVTNVGRFLFWGYRLDAIQDNVASSLLDALPVHSDRDRLRSSLTTHLLDLGSPKTAGTSEPLENAAQYERLRLSLINDSTVDRVRPWIDGRTITSMEVIKVRGNYTRIELAPDYFRARQQELARSGQPLSAPFEAAPEYWNTFVGALDLFQEHHIRLVVNEVEEAPYKYNIGNNGAYYRDFMKQVHRYVAARGIPYVRVAWEDFTDAEYFDFNHLNSQGIEHFTRMAAPLLRPELK